MVSMTTFAPSLAFLEHQQRHRARFDELFARACERLDAFREDSRDRFLSSVLIMALAGLLLVRSTDLMWSLPALVLILAIGLVALQHLLIVYAMELRATAMPLLCEAVGRLRHLAGEAPDLDVSAAVAAGLIPGHDRRLIEDVFIGEHRGHRFTLASLGLWTLRRNPATPAGLASVFQGVVLAIDWRQPLEALPGVGLLELVEGRRGIEISQIGDKLILTLPCPADPFPLAGLFTSRAGARAMLETIVHRTCLAHRLIDHLAAVAPRSGEPAGSKIRAGGTLPILA
jgi:hypothetical protein